VDALIFVLAGLTSIICCIVVVAQTSPVRAALFLIMAFFAQAVLFVQLSALFVAALQIIVYAGAIMVLFLFIIMLLNLRKAEFGADKHPLQRFAAIVLGVSLLFEIIMVLYWSLQSGGTRTANIPAGFGSVESIGELLFTKYLLPFEATSFLLMAAILGAVVLAKKRLDK